MEKTPTQQSDRYAGRIVGIFGLQGELKCDPTSAGRTIFTPGATLRCVREGKSDSVVTVSALREHQARPLIRLQGVEGATQAEQYVGAKFYAPRSAFILLEGEYLDEDLLGCTLQDSDGKALGNVDALEHYPSQDLLVVGKARIPMVRAFIRSVNIERKLILVDLPVGLLDPEHAEEA
ncbi:MAG: ribosome maturation factor RimM [Candidatus Eremiobacteraeota bacterium]|nr:ribosome maturation factor RimM [Candidatus Eremiobacteraeota bacterium]